MAQEKTTTMADGTVSKVTALPEGCTLALFDSSGGVSKIDAQKFMELVRGSIQIGGRNLLKGTKDFSGGRNTDSLVTADTYKGCRILSKSNQYGDNGFLAVLEGGRTYMASAYIKGNPDERPFISFKYYPIGGPYTTAAQLSLEVKGVASDKNSFSRQSACFTPAQDCEVLFSIQKNVAGDVLSFCGMKLEEGNIATDWTPAPEDFGGGKIALYPISYAALFAATVEAAHHSEERRAA